jgi:DNA-binding MarR family transcriptional regulator
MKRSEAILALLDEAAGLFHVGRALAEEIHDGETAGRRGILRDLARLGPRTVPQLARMRPVSRQHIQGIVNSLLEDGYVETAGNPEHRRSSLVRITAKGEKAFRQMIDDELRALDTLPRSITREEAESAGATLRKVREALAGLKS